MGKHKSKYMKEIGFYLDMYEGEQPFPEKIQARVEEIVNVIDSQQTIRQRMITHNLWEPEEEQYIIDNQDKSIMEIAADLNRKYTSTAVKIAAMREDGKLPKVSYRSQRIEKECEYIKENKHLSNVELAKRLGVSPDTIKNRKYKMKQGGYEDISRKRRRKLDQAYDFIKSHLDLSEKEMAERLDVTARTVRVYKSNMRKQNII